MKRIWLLVLMTVVVTGAAVVTHRVIGANSKSSSPKNHVTDVKSSDSTISGEVVPPPRSAPVEVSQRSPGMRPQPMDALKLPVPRTLDLTYVTAANFASALGDDPGRIFNYVRDEIAYEAYTGCLRGPRGTLLALAGNSVDRASLLASMLQHAGQRVRFAHGPLPEPLARELVTSIWADRPQPPADTRPAPAAAQAAIQTVVGSVKRNYTLIRDQLKQASVALGPQSAPSFDSLVRETEDHYWIQWSSGGKWVDLDPSFSDSAPGIKYAAATDNFDALPDA